MKYFLLISIFAFGLLPMSACADEETMDYKEYTDKSVEIQKFRDGRMLDLPAALAMAKEGKAVLVDVRDGKDYRAKHIKGAVNLSVAEITEENLAKVVPSKDTPVILYCDNGIERSISRKVAASSIAYPAFYVHGYHNLYELRPLIGQENAEEQEAMIPWEQD